MAGYRGLRVSSPTASRVDYKGGGDLKSCFSEFSLNPLVAPPSVGHSPILPSIVRVTYFIYCHTFVRHLSQTKRPCADRPPHLFRARYLQIIADHWYYSLVLRVLFLRSHTAIPPSTYVDIRTTHVKHKVYARRF